MIHLVGFKTITVCEDGVLEANITATDLHEKYYVLFLIVLLDVVRQCLRTQHHKSSTPLLT